MDPLLNQLLASFKLAEVDQVKKADGDKELAGRILLVYDLFRRRMTQIEERRGETPGAARRPDLKGANLLMTRGARTNQTKRIGNVPGVEVGDIFFFRMELCLVGLHAPSMAGIDYMSVRLTGDEEPIAVSIVSSGGYDDEGDDGEVLIYTGQGGVQRRDGQMFDQKLERGNLALEKSVHRRNEVRVIRGVVDVQNGGGARSTFMMDFIGSRNHGQRKANWEIAAFSGTNCLGYLGSPRHLHCGNHFSNGEMERLHGLSYPT